MSPFIDLPPEIGQQPFSAGETVTPLKLADMEVIALARLIVEAQDAFAFRDQRQGIFEIVVRSANRLGHPPNLHFHEECRFELVAFVEKKLGFHVGEYNNTTDALSSTPTLTQARHRKMAGFFMSRHSPEFHPRGDTGDFGDLWMLAKFLISLVGAV
ncbi:MAG: hypothetical protein KDH19_00495 [Geminicoccaceae bacterium]|nr:hypothetical protein [Geminicoccaceae bacterium]